MLEQEQSPFNYLHFWGDFVYLSSTQVIETLRRAKVVSLGLDPLLDLVP